MDVADYPSNPYFSEDNPEHPVVRHRHMNSGRRLAGWPANIGGQPSGCVIHFTAGWEAEFAFTIMEKRNYSAHMVIERDGTIYLGVPLSSRAVHAGGSWKGHGNINHRFIGIELVNFGHVDAYARQPGEPKGMPHYRPSNSGQSETGIDPNAVWAYRVVNYGSGDRAVMTQQQIDDSCKFAAFPQAQINALLWVVNSMSTQLGWREDDIVGHDFIDDHKQDPGPAFPWELFHSQLEATVPVDWHGAQDLLQQMGLYTGMIDGLFGPLTMRAVYTITGLNPGNKITKELWREIVLAWADWRYDEKQNG